MLRTRLVSVCLLALSAFGQQEVTTRDQSVPTFKTSVNMVNVPVVVRDFEGRPVGNLTKENFQLFDKGKPQTILQFVAEKSENPARVHEIAAPAGGVVATQSAPEISVPDRFLAYLFDDAHTQMPDLIRARDAADAHMKKLGPKVRAAVFTLSGQIMLDFTDDRAKWHETLFRLMPHTIAGAGERDCPNLTYYWADRIRNHNDAEANSFAAIAAAACSGGGASRSTVSAAVARVIARHEQESHVGLDLLRGLVQRMSVMPGERTVVLASPGFLTQIDSKDDENTIINRAIRAKVVINSLDVRGLAVEVPDLTEPPPAIQGGSLADFMHYVQDRKHEVFMAQSDVLAELAAGTGGTFYHNNNDLGAGFDRVAGAPDYRYILSFSPQNLKADGTLHGLKVTLAPNPHHYDIEARRSYTAPKRLDDPVEQAKQEITEAIFSRDELSDIPLELHAEYFKLAAGRARLTSVTHVDLKPLKLRKTEGRNHDDLTVTTGVFDNNGNYVAGTQRGVELRLKDETFDKWMANGITVRSNVEVKPGNYLVRVVVRDSEGQLMAARNGSISIP